MEETNKEALNRIMNEATKCCFSGKYSLYGEELVYYYTDLDALLNGIIVNEPKYGQEICLWATRCTHLNDKNELIEGINKLSDIVSPTAIKKLKEDTCKGHSLSFSRKCDSLPMWSMYGKNGTGVMLAFKVMELMDKYEDRFQPCVYTGTQYESDVYQIMKRKDWGYDYINAPSNMKLKTIICMCSQYIMLLKNGAFEYEDECRVIGIGFPYFSTEGNRKTLYRNKNGAITPYIEEYLPKTMLKEVWLGPNSNPELSKATLEEFLNSRGFNVEVKMSKVPYRG